MARPSQPLLLVLLIALSWSGSGACYGQSPSGVYTGFVDSENPIGFVQLALNHSGAGTLQVKIAGEPTFSAKVALASSGDILPANGAQNPPFSLASDSQGNVSGTVMVDGQADAVTLVNAAPGAFAMNAAGRYTLVLDDGTHLGYGSLQVSQFGSARFSLSLVDGPTLTQGGTLNSAGELPLFASHASYLLSGPVQFADETAADCTGSLTLVHFGPTSTQEAATLSGSRYQSKLGFALSGWTIYFSAGNNSSLPAQLENLTFSDKAHTRLVGNSGGTRVGLTLDPKSGALHGSASASTAFGSVHYALNGVIFQKTGAPVGTIFAGAAVVGEFSLGVPGSPTTTTGGGSITGGTLILNGGGGLGGTIVNGVTTITSGGTLTITGPINTIGTIVNPITITPITATPITITPITITTINPITINPITVTPITITGTTTLTLGGTISGTSGGVITFYNPGSGGAITLSGSGTLQLNQGTNTFTGGTIVSGGTLNLSGGSIAGSTVTLINPASISLVSSTVGAGTLQLSGTANTFTGVTTVSGGTLTAGNPITEGSITANAGGLTLTDLGTRTPIVLTGGTITNSGDATVSNGALEISGSVSIAVDGVTSGN